MGAVAGRTHDVVIDGKGYMLTAGGYRRATAPVAEGKGGGTFRQTAWRRRAVEVAGGADGESVWVAEGMLPVADGAGLGIAPAATWDTTIATATTEYGGAADYRGTLYLAAGATIYAVATVTTGLPEVVGTYAGLSAARTCAAAVRQLFVHGGRLYAALGAGGYDIFDGTSWASASAAADLFGSFAGLLFRATGAELYWTDTAATWYPMPLFERVMGFAHWDGGYAIGTERGLRLMRGTRKPLDPNLPTNYDWWDFTIEPVLDIGPLVTHEAGSLAHLQSYGGRLYYWHAGRVWAWDGRRAERQPVQGLFLGLCQMAGYLVAGVVNDQDGYQVWLHDGAGWWLLARSTSATTRFAWPVGGAGIVKGAGLYAWNQGTRALARWDFRVNGRVWGTGHAAPVVALPAIDGGTPEQMKRWTEIGLLLGVPEGPAVLAGAPATYHVEVSPDAFASVTAVGSVTPGALIGGAFFAPTDLDARRLWARVRVTGGGPDNPAIRALTARWRAGALATPRRRWEVAVRASDQVVTLSGARDDRGGAEVAADLAALVGGPPVAFQDLDGASATVIVAEVEETAVRGAAPRAGEGSARVVLEEAV